MRPIFFAGVVLCLLLQTFPFVAPPLGRAGVLLLANEYAAGPVPADGDGQAARFLRPHRTGGPRNGLPDVWHSLSKAPYVHP